MLPVLFGGTCDWKWKDGPTMTVKHRKRDRERVLLSSQPFTFHFHFWNHEQSPPCSLPATFPWWKAGWMSAEPQHGSCVVLAGRGFERDGRVGERMWVEREVGWGFALTFTLAPQLMLRCCHFHHLKCCHFRCRSLAFAVGAGGGQEGGSLGRFPF